MKRKIAEALWAFLFCCLSNPCKDPQRPFPVILEDFGRRRRTEGEAKEEKEEEEEEEQKKNKPN